jgi:hypothetical protein
MVDKLRIIHQDKFKEIMVMIVMRLSANSFERSR